MACAVRIVDGRVEQARIAVGSVGARAVRAVESEGVLRDSASDDRAALVRAAELAAKAAEPVDDANGSADYKANLVRVLVERCFREAAAACS